MEHEELCILILLLPPPKSGQGHHVGPLLLPPQRLPSPQPIRDLYRRHPKVGPHDALEDGAGATGGAGL